MDILRKNKRILLVTALFVALSTLSFAKSTDVMYVCQDKISLTQKASVRSAKVEAVPYGTALIIIKQYKNWYFVSLETNQKIQGWIPVGSVTKKKISSKNTASTANTSELALAGKGFSKAIEEAYMENYEVNFSDVNWMERQISSVENTYKFIAAGELEDGEE